MEKRRGLFRFLLVVVIGMVLSLGMYFNQQAFAESEENENYGALLKVIQQSKVSLCEGLRQAAKGAEIPISAKFEVDDKGNLSLSIYAAEKGLAVAPQNNLFKELSGSPESATWNPGSEVIKDEGDLAHAKEQLTILSKAKGSLLDIATQAEKDYNGTIFSIIPEVKGNKSVCEVKIANNGQVNERYYNVVTGKEAKMSGY